jgi:clan AA aspartic protease (TIGR02281 family)
VFSNCKKNQNVAKRNKFAAVGPYIGRLVFLLTIPLLCSCAEKFKYDDVDYATRDAAEAVARDDISRQQNFVPKITSRVHGSIVIVIPTTDIIHQYGIVATGNPSDNEIHYISDVLELGFLGFAGAVQIGGAFDQVTVVRSTDSGSYPGTGYDYKLWLLAISHSQWQWYLSKNGSSDKMPISVDQGVPHTQRSAAFDEAVVSGANLLRGTVFGTRSPPATFLSADTPSSNSSAEVNSERDAERYVVALKTEGGTYVVPVLINGAITLDFVVDSGASDVSIPADVVLTLMRTGTLNSADFRGTQTYVMADGTEVPSDIFIIRSLKIGNHTIHNISGSVGSVSGSLLLGQSFLKQFKSWSIDNRTHSLVFR